MFSILLRAAGPASRIVNRGGGGGWQGQQRKGVKASFLLTAALKLHALQKGAASICKAV